MKTLYVWTELTDDGFGCIPYAHVAPAEGEAASDEQLLRGPPMLSEETAMDGLVRLVRQQWPEIEIRFERSPHITREDLEQLPRR